MHTYLFGERAGLLDHTRFIGALVTENQVIRDTGSVCELHVYYREVKVTFYI